MINEKVNTDITNIADEFTIGIGKITLKCALLEALIQNCANILIGGESASIATAKLSFQSLLDTLSALYKQTPYINQESKSPKNLDELLSMANDAANERNKIVHSIWYIHVGDLEKPFTRIKRNIRRKQGLSIDTEKMSVDDLKVVTKKLDSAIVKAREFINDILVFYGSVLLVSPADGANVDLKPELTWKSLKLANGYELTISKEWNFVDNFISKMDNESVKDSKYKCETPLDSNTTYYWRVRPVFSTVPGYWSEIRGFTVK